MTEWSEDKSLTIFSKDTKPFECKLRRLGFSPDLKMTKCIGYILKNGKELKKIYSALRELTDVRDCYTLLGKASDLSYAIYSENGERKDKVYQYFSSEEMMEHLADIYACLYVGQTLETRIISYAEKGN